MRVTDAVTIEDLRELAKRRLPSFAFMPLETGAGNGDNVVRNVQRFRQSRLTARVLTDVSEVNQSKQIFGRTYASPFGISAAGGLDNLRVGSDLFQAAAARDADIPYVLSVAANASIEQAAAVAPAHVWSQLNGSRDPAITDHLIGRARDIGVEVLVYTPARACHSFEYQIGTSTVNLRRRIPLRVWPTVIGQALTHPAWTIELLRHGFPHMQEGWRHYAAPGADAAQVSMFLQTQIPCSQSWADVERVRRLWPGKLVIKGIVHPDDAIRALETGADGIQVSTHGGNKLDRMLGSLDYLPMVRQAVGQRALVFFDSGIRRGADVVTALCLGADFCFIGRASLYGSIAGAKPGVDRALQILRNEIVYTMSMMGVPNLGDLHPSLVVSE